MAELGRCAFFYGTLMAPQVMHRVCHGSMSADNPIYATHKLKTYPAVLHGYRRSRVRHADYPGILLDPTASVRGTYVTGLTDSDSWRLDIFEGKEYRRDKVKVRLLNNVGDESGKGNVEGEEVFAETYVWSSNADRLEEREWDFAEFQREKMRFWVGAEGEGEYAEVDEAVAAQQSDGTGGRGPNGHISHALKAEQMKDEVLKNAV
ncbi:hypothetical protein EJ03DRAFT_328077 [Teratosphaeria nubilosa]|uniref:Putative gamma-glutamylcyclotransferase n=1 Tax=Teratosphaeria nubilosa TaxID=161662 RepID=A0A6G1L7F1_9PEZI|nr:hypothetical protein EJ03DRAFT_328077 [Teratosphaeria nubilosa]